jgi:hypothetical protein
MLAEVKRRVDRAFVYELVADRMAEVESNSLCFTK